MYYIYIYNKEYFYVLLSAKQVNYNVPTKNISIELKLSQSYKNVFEKTLKIFFYSLNSYFLKKIKFKGKSYKIEKVNKLKYIYELNFGHSIFTCVTLNNLKIKQLQKTKLFLWSTNNITLTKKITSIRELRPWNKYSQRGLRLGKQLIYKKAGKKSTFV